MLLCLYKCCFSLCGMLSSTVPWLGPTSLSRINPYDTPSKKLFLSLSNVLLSPRGSELRWSSSAPPEHSIPTSTSTIAYILLCANASSLDSAKRSSRATTFHSLLSPPLNIGHSNNSICQINQSFLLESFIYSLLTDFSEIFLP